MEYLKVAGGKASPRRELRSSKSQRQQKTMMNNLMEAITQVNEGGGVDYVSETNENGVLRMKIMVRKQDLGQMLEAMNNNSPLSSSSSVEQRLNLLRRKHLLRAVNASGKETRRRSWRPVLQSIPEEL